MLRDRLVLAPLFAFVAGGCLASQPTSAPEAESPVSAAPEARSPAVEAAPPEQATPEETVVRKGLVVHEWGTFTSVQGADGVSLPGMHHEEESLPEFVFKRRLEAVKGIPPVGEPVTQKLETPVIYFYSDEPLEVSVEVDFPEGVFGEWYPDATRLVPKLTDAPFLDKVGPGMARWDVSLDPALPDALIPYVHPDDIWAPSREVAATPLRFGDQGEAFIFYRGIGRFEPPLRVLSASDEELVARNDYAEPLTAFLIRKHAGGASITPLPPLAPAGATTSLSPPPKEFPVAAGDEFVETASAMLAEALVGTGLFEDEAWAMVNTWSRSWLQAEGLRLLYLVPRSYTDRVLPMRLSPAPAADRPQDLVRTLVGRVEILTPGEERALVDDIRAASEADEPYEAFDWQRLGRLAEPKLHRAVALLGDDEPVKRYASALLALAVERP